MKVNYNESYSCYQRWKTTPLSECPLLSVVIPTYNEAARIVPTVGAVASYCSGLSIPWELIIADDGSTDETVTLLEGLGFMNLQVLRAPRNGGKGSAVRRGILAARGAYILFADADNSTPIEELGNLLAHLDEGFDVVVGSRAVVGAVESSRSLHRRAISGGLRLLIRHFFKLGVVDSQCGFKLFRRHVGQQLCTLQTIDGFSFDLELLYLANKLGYRVVEQPVQWVDAPGSKVNPRKEMMRFLKDLFYIRLNDLNGRYNRAIVTLAPTGVPSITSQGA